ncbi:MAG: hypothetical protein ACXWUG_12475 [Polyangiales bacterium]
MSEKLTLGRRAFLGGGIAVLGTAASSALSPKKAEAAAWMLPSTSPETPNAHQIATIKKMADTFIPNADGQPGAIESNAFDTINDPYYGLNPYISEVVSDIDDATYWLHTYFDDFMNRSLSERTSIMEERLGYVWWSTGSAYVSAYEGMIALTKLNFFGGLINNVGTNYIGYPGPSTGYLP